MGRNKRYSKIKFLAFFINTFVNFIQRFIVNLPNSFLIFLVDNFVFVERFGENKNFILFVI